MKDTIEYKLISEYYGGDVAERSRVPLMNHINEGLKILDFIGGTEIAKRAFCIHPMLQNDRDLKKNIFNPTFDEIDFPILLTAMEFRKTANSYLSNRIITCLNDIKLSPIRDVNDMLIADKVQNFKDFELYYKDIDERSSELTLYFNNWVRRLDCDYQHIKSYITHETVEMATR